MDAILALACGGFLALLYGIGERSLWFGLKVGAAFIALMFALMAVGL